MSKIEIIPLGDKVLLQKEKKQKESPSGFVLPDTSSQERGLRGKVVAVGSGRLLDNGEMVPVAVKKGDTVLFASYGGEEVKIDGTEYHLVREDQLLAIIKVNS